MVKAKRSNPQMIQGGINITGNVEIKDSKIAGRDNIEKEIVNLNISFAPVYHALKESKRIAPATKKTLEKQIKQIEQEVKKGDKAKAPFIQERLENIQKMAPDISEVMIASLQNPVAGVSLAIQKVVKKFQADKSNR